jgi:hypothetical protein
VEGGEDDPLEAHPQNPYRDVLHNALEVLRLDGDGAGEPIRRSRPGVRQVWKHQAVSRFRQTQAECARDDGIRPQRLVWAVHLHRPQREKGEVSTASEILGDFRRGQIAHEPAFHTNSFLALHRSPRLAGGEMRAVTGIAGADGPCVEARPVALTDY